MLFDCAEQPGLSVLMLLLERLDRLGVLQSQADVIQAVEQAMLAKGVDLKPILLAVRAGHDLRSQVHSQLVAFGGLGLLKQFITFFFLQEDRQQAVFETVVEEDLGKAGRNDRTETVLSQGPGRMLTTGATTEVLPR